MIFTSTSCLKGKTAKFEHDVTRILDAYKRIGIKNIELGAAHQPEHDVNFLLKKCREIEGNFICHCNFPPTGDKRMLNMCSQNKEMQKLTISAAKNSIEFLNKLGGTLFSTHFGYTADIAVDGGKVSDEVSYEKAMETGANILGQVCDYAQNYGINVAAETQPYFDFCMLVRPGEFSQLMKMVAMKNLGILMDLGHITLTEQKLCIRREEFVKLQDRILEFHVHEVVSGIDHQMPKDASVFRGFDRDVLKKACLTLEASELTENQIMHSLAVIEEALH